MHQGDGITRPQTFFASGVTGQPRIADIVSTARDGAGMPCPG